MGEPKAEGARAKSLYEAGRPAAKERREGDAVKRTLTRETLEEILDDAGLDPEGGDE